MVHLARTVYEGANHTHLSIGIAQIKLIPPTM